MAFFKNDKLMMIGGGGQILRFRRQLLLKITSGLKNSPAYVFWFKKLKNDIEIALKSTGIELQAKSYPYCMVNMQCISVKKMICTIAE